VKNAITMPTCIPPEPCRMTKYSFGLARTQPPAVQPQKSPSLGSSGLSCIAFPGNSIGGITPTRQGYRNLFAETSINGQACRPSLSQAAGHQGECLVFTREAQSANRHLVDSPIHYIIAIQQSGLSPNLAAPLRSGAHHAYRDGPCSTAHSGTMDCRPDEVVSGTSVIGDRIVLTMASTTFCISSVVVFQANMSPQNICSFYFAKSWSLATTNWKLERLSTFRFPFPVRGTLTYVVCYVAV
jgi:hypothetical protein